eukprot:1045571_1
MSMDMDLKLTTRQNIYVFGLQGFGPLILNGGINGVIAWLIYSTTTDPLSLWLMPMPLAGDLFVTTMVQSILTWLSVGILVRNDLRRNNISAIEIQSEQCGDTKETNTKCIAFADNMKQYPISFPLQKDNINRITRSTLWYCLLAIILFVIPSFIVLAIIQIIDHDIDHQLNYVDMIVAKAVYGGIMGLIMTPIAAICSLSAESSNKSKVIDELPQLQIISNEC